MNYYKRTEYLLYNYKMLEISIENMQQKIKYFKENDGATGISYDGISTSPTFKTSSMTENIALSNAEEIHYLEHCIERNKRTLENIDRVMGELETTEKEILTQRYILSKPWHHVTAKVNYGERHCKRLRTIAIKKMVVGLFGVVVEE